MKIDFSSEITRTAEDKHVLVMSATVSTEAEAHKLKAWVTAAMRDAAGRQKVRNSRLIIPPRYRV